MPLSEELPDRPLELPEELLPVASSGSHTVRGMRLDDATTPEDPPDVLLPPPETTGPLPPVEDAPPPDDAPMALEASVADELAPPPVLDDDEEPLPGAQAIWPVTRHTRSSIGRA